jgi:hypothetical protein
MSFKTETSIWDVKIDSAKKKIVLKKTAIKPGKDSAAKVGQEFEGTKIEIDSLGTVNLYEGDRIIVSTSRLQKD